MSTRKTTRRSPRTFTEPFKLQVVSDYYANGCHSVITAHKWDVPAHSIKLWIKDYCKNGKKFVSLHPETDSEPAMDEERTKVERLQREISELKESLAYERMRSAAYERLLEIIKKEDGIDLLKKDGAKQ